MGIVELVAFVRGPFDNGEQAEFENNGVNRGAILKEWFSRSEGLGLLPNL